ncbi:MAG TPA: YaeQ family protein [Vicinamibacterales bacterium]|nr:YaeQ family protein [Vicinamibacterales bacterium]
MALTATVYNFHIDLADADRGVYETLDLRMAQHPSESEEYFIARLLAYCLEYTEGIGFSNGISDPEEPTIAVRDLTGKVRVWIEIGAPAAARLHKASKAANRVAVYTHRDPAQLMRELAGEKIHRASDVEIYSFDRAFIAALAARLERRMSMAVSISERHVLVAMDEGTCEGSIATHRLP